MHLIKAVLAPLPCSSPFFLLQDLECIFIRLFLGENGDGLGVGKLDGV